MRREVRLPVLLAGVVGLALLSVGIVYLTVQCQALPGLLGPIHGDTSPRTGLGIAGVLLGVGSEIVALAGAWRRPPTAPRRR